MSSPDVAALLAQLDAALTPSAAPGAPQVPEGGEVASPPREQVLRFDLCGLAFALPTRQVRAIARVAHVARVPGVGPHIAGVTLLRGNVLPLIDLATLLGLTTEEPPQQFIVINDGGIEAGLLVHYVDTLVAAPALLPVLETRPPAWQALLQGELAVGHEMLLLLNPSMLLSRSAELG